MKSHDFSGADELSESIAKMWRSSAGNLLQHTKLSSQETKAETLLLFKKVKQTLKYYSKYPHEISGGKNNVS
jgi:ABC-type microcin C transport system duplicated ATPase subunit YejF